MKHLYEYAESLGQNLQEIKNRFVLVDGDGRYTVPKLTEDEMWWYLCGIDRGKPKPEVKDWGVPMYVTSSVQAWDQRAESGMGDKLLSACQAVDIAWYEESLDAPQWSAMVSVLDWDQRDLYIHLLNIYDQRRRFLDMYDQRRRLGGLCNEG